MKRIIFSILGALALPKDSFLPMAAMPDLQPITAHKNSKGVAGDWQAVGDDMRKAMACVDVVINQPNKER